MTLSPDNALLNKLRLFKLNSFLLTFDFIINNYRLEVKTKDISKVPNFKYVYTKRLNDCDFLIFNHLVESVGIVFICGWISQENFRLKSSHLLPNTNLEGTNLTRSGHEFLLKIEDLKPMNELVELLTGVSPQTPRRSECSNE